MSRLTPIPTAVMIAMVGLMGSPTPASAQEAERQEEQRAEVLAPWLDEATFAVVHIDLEQLDLAEARRGLKAMTPESEHPHIAQWIGPVQAMHQMVIGAGATDLYLLMSTLHRPLGEPAPAPILVIPLAEGANAPALIAFLMQQTAFGEIEGYQARQHDDALVIGPEHALD